MPIKFILPLLFTVSVFVFGFSASAEETGSEEETGLNCSRVFEGDGKGTDTSSHKKNIVIVACVFPSQQSKWEFLLTAEAEDDENPLRAQLKRLTLSKDGVISQELEVKGDIWLRGIERAVSLMDINFDGHHDVRLWVSTSAGPNMGYDYFIFDPESGHYLYSEEAGALSGFDVMFNKEARTLSVSSRSSCCAWGLTEYRWQKNKLVVFKSSSSGMAASLHVPGLEPSFMYVCGEVVYYYNSHQELESIDVAFDNCSEEEGGSASLSREEVLSKLKNGKGFELKAMPQGPIQLRFKSPVPANNF